MNNNMLLFFKRTKIIYISVVFCFIYSLNFVSAAQESSNPKKKDFDSRPPQSYKARGSSLDDQITKNFDKQISKNDDKILQKNKAELMEVSNKEKSSDYMKIINSLDSTEKSEYYQKMQATEVGLEGSSIIGSVDDNYKNKHNANKVFVTLNLKEAIIRGYEKNNELAAARHKYQAAIYAHQSVTAEFLPSINFKYRRGRGNIQTSLEFFQPLFDLGIATKSHLFDERATLQYIYMLLEEQKIILEIIRSYLATSLEKQKLDLSVNNVERHKEELEVTSGRYNLGRSTITDLAQSESRLAIALANRDSTFTSLLNAKSGFFRLMNSSNFDVNAEVNSLLEKIPLFIDGFQDFKKVVLKNNLDLAAFYRTTLIDERELDVMRSSLAPKLGFEAGYVSLADEIAKDDIINVALKFDFPMANFPAYKESWSLEQSAIASGLEYHEFYKRVIVKIETLWNKYKMMLSQIKYKEKSVIAAEIALKGVIQESELGRRTTLDVLDAEYEYFENKVNLLESQYDFARIQYDMIYLMGFMLIENV